MAGQGPGLESVADSGTESSTNAKALTDLGLISLGHARFLPGNIFSVATESITESASERGGWRWRGGGGKSMEKYSIPHWDNITLFGRKQSQVKNNTWLICLRTVVIKYGTLVCIWRSTDGML